VLMIIGQLGDFNGYYSSYSSKIAQVAYLLLNERSIQLATLSVGLITIALIYLLRPTRFSKFSLLLALLVASAIAILLNRLLAANIKLVGDITEVPSSLPRMFLPDPMLMVKLIIPAIAIGIIRLVQGAGVSQTFPNPDGSFSNVSHDFLGQSAANLANGVFLAFQQEVPAPARR
jgi:SulP family sulfate permease